MATLREESRGNLTGTGTVEHYTLGCLQRIADATEMMAKNYIDVQNERDSLIRRLNYRDERILKLENRIRGLKGAITRLKKVTKKSR